MLRKLYKATQLLDAIPDSKWLFTCICVIRDCFGWSDISVYLPSGVEHLRLLASTAPNNLNTIRLDSENTLITCLHEQGYFVNESHDPTLPEAAFGFYDTYLKCLITIGNKLSDDDVRLFVILMHCIYWDVLHTCYQADFIRSDFIRSDPISDKEFTDLLRVYYDAKEAGLLNCELLISHTDLDYYELVKSVRETDFVGHIKGDTFILAVNCDHASLDKLVTRLNKLGFKFNVAKLCDYIDAKE